MPGRVMGAAFLASVAGAVLGSAEARAADAGRGQRLAESHCASCHNVALTGRVEVADAPPFEVIGAKYNFSAGDISAAIVGPHRKMNFSPDPAAAADIAAYIATLRR
jgi:mono/diheme cytochrome c family protein